MRPRKSAAALGKKVNGFEKNVCYKMREQSFLKESAVINEKVAKLAKALKSCWNIADQLGKMNIRYESQRHRGGRAFIIVTLVLHLHPRKKLL